MSSNGFRRCQGIIVVIYKISKHYIILLLYIDDMLIVIAYKQEIGKVEKMSYLIS